MVKLFLILNSLLVGIIGMDMASDLNLPYGTKKWVINFYQEQLDYFNKVGLGNRTTHDVKITPELIEITEKRLAELSVVYDASITPQEYKLRRSAKYRAEKEKLNGQLDSNTTTTTSRMQNNGSTRHERDKS